MNEETFTVYLYDFVIEFLGDSHSKPIPYEWAEVIYHKLQNKSLACIQWTDEFDNKLKRPILWQYKAWVTATEKWQAEKERSRKRIIDYEVRKRNIALLADMIQAETLLDDERSVQIAMSWILKEKTEKIKMVGVTLEESNYE